MLLTDTLSIYSTKHLEKKEEKKNPVLIQCKMISTYNYHKRRWIETKTQNDKITQLVSIHLNDVEEMERRYTY